MVPTYLDAGERYRGLLAQADNSLLAQASAKEIGIIVGFSSPKIPTCRMRPAR
jgi:hypothetical protein